MKNKKWTAWYILTAICICMVLEPMGQINTALAAEEGTYSESGFWDSAVSATPSATATGGGITTPTPVPTPTKRPAVTAKPKADISLKNEFQNVVLTVGTTGEFDIDRSSFASYPLEDLVELHYSSNDSSVLQVTANGSYQAVKVGETVMTVTGIDRDGNTMFYCTYTVSVYPDMSKVTLAKQAVQIYIVKNSYNSTNSAQIAIQGGDSQIFDSDRNANLIYEVISSNKKMYVSTEISNGKVVITCSDAGSTTLTLKLYGKEYKIQLKVSVLEMSAGSALLAGHQTKQLRVKGYRGSVVWKSSRPKVASVSKNGKVSAKKTGNTIITAKVGNVRVGCVVSVTTTTKKKVIRRAQKMASTSQYSQPKRMLKGYYDCSSLVWRAYAKYGYRFGVTGYAPTAAGEAQYLANRNKLLKGGFSRKNAQTLKFKAGDLMFKTGASNGRYKGIYHVEMIIGYEFYGWDQNNKPVLLVKWANRPDGYYGYGIGIVGKM